MRKDARPRSSHERRALDHPPGGAKPLNVTVLSMHTSPLAQPGVGDGGGMNVYVRELSAALARAGVECDVYTRADRTGLAPTVNVEPGFRVHHVAAGPIGPLPKEALPAYTEAFADSVELHLEGSGRRPDVIHANYWLSADAGHVLKHRLDVPLAVTFHTLARVKAEGNDHEPEARALAEARIIGCADLLLASCSVEREQLMRLYGAEASRIEEVPLGVDHAFFSPGPKAGARAALGFGDHPVLLFVGRIQPLKGAAIAVEALAELSTRHPDAVLVIVGGPSGSEGVAELGRIHDLIDAHGLSERVRFVSAQAHHVLSTYFRSADVVLVPSRSESFGLVALEASACGTPVVAANVGGLRTLVDDGQSGFLINGRDPAAYAAAVSAILDNPALAEQMRNAAAVRSRRYAWSVTAGRLRRVYTDLSSRSLVACV